MHRGHSQRQRHAMPKSRRKHLPPPGPVNAFQTTSWESRSPLRPTINHWYVPLLSTKHLDAIPPRVLRPMSFDYSIAHVPGKELYTADALSRAPQHFSSQDEQQVTTTENHVSTITDHLPTLAESLSQYCKAKQYDQIL